MKAIPESIAEQADQSGACFTVHAEVAAPITIPAGFKVADYPGLLFCYGIRRDRRRDIVVTVWQSGEAYQAHGAACFAALGGEPTVGGWLGPTVCNEPPWHVRAAKAVHAGWVVALVASAATLYTNTETLRAGWAAIFEKPACQLIEVTPPRVVVNDTLASVFSAKVSNTSEVSAYIRLSGITVVRRQNPIIKQRGFMALPSAPLAAQPLPVERLPGPAKIKPYEDGIVRLWLRPVTAGDFEITLIGSAKNDWGASANIQLPLSLSIWPMLRAEILGYLPNRDKKTCVILGILRSGDAQDNGVSMDFQLVRVPGVDFSRDSYLQQGRAMTLNVQELKITPGQELAQALVEDREKVGAFSERWFMATLLSTTDRGPAEWERIAGALSVSPYPTPPTSITSK